MSTTNHENHIYVLMGVSGSGKSAVASEVAHQLKENRRIQKEYFGAILQPQVC